MYFRRPFSIYLCFLEWSCSKDSLKPQNYWPYLGFRNINILSTFDLDISLNWEYHPEQCPTLLSTVYWDNGAGCTINDTWVQSHVSFILLELGARCIFSALVNKSRAGQEIPVSISRNIIHGRKASALVTKSYSNQDKGSISLLLTVGQISGKVQSLVSMGSY